MSDVMPGSSCMFFIQLFLCVLAGVCEEKVISHRYVFGRVSKTPRDFGVPFENCWSRVVEV